MGKKTLQDIKTEYGFILRWNNGKLVTDTDGSLKTVSETRFYLENINTGEIIDIQSDEALDFISSKTVTGFRRGIDLYDNYVELFKILNIEPV